MKYRKKKPQLGKTEDGTSVCITSEQLPAHLHRPGGSARGNSRVFETLIRERVRKGEGFTLLDPHGSVYDRAVAWCARHGAHKNKSSP